MLKRIIDVATKRENADLILKNVVIVNVFSGKLQKGDIAVCGGFIAGIGSYDNSQNIVDCQGKYALPGFIDSHVHIESSHLSPVEFAKAVLPCGTTTVIADPHEIANVCGIEGIKYIYDECKKTPLDAYIMFPSCVPATPFETSGAVLSSKHFKKYLNNPMFLGVGELMNYPGVIGADDEVLKKIEIGKDYGKIIDGHASELSEEQLNAYIAAGISTNHECTDSEQMQKMLDRGMHIQIREGSATKNLRELAKGISKENISRCLFCTDDKTPAEIFQNGHIDNNIRIAVECGIDFISAVKMATINAANCYGLKNKGAIAPGYIADILIADSIENLNITEVYKSGVIVAKDKKPLFCAEQNIPKTVINTIRLGEINSDKLQIKLNNGSAKVIKLIEKSIITESVIRSVPVKEGCFVVNDSGFNKLVVAERHKKSGNIGLGILEGYGIKGGAVATTVAHDSHNIIAAGDNDEDLLCAIKELELCGGGIAVCSAGKILYSLPLPIAGLLSDKSAADFIKAYSKITEIAFNLGVNKNIEPFMSLSFLSLAVLPHLKVTDKGLFDVDKFQFTAHDA
jgi:adenine deaminase